MNASFKIGERMTAPHLEVQITKDGIFKPEMPCCDGKDVDNIVDLTGATVAFQLTKCGRLPITLTLTGVTEIVDALNGIAKHRFSSNDTFHKGLYYGRFIVNFSDGSKYLWPSNYQELTIEVF